MRFEHKLEDFLLWLEENYVERLVQVNKGSVHYLNLNEIRCRVRELIKQEEEEK